MNALNFIVQVAVMYWFGDVKVVENSLGCISA
jgi:hypothetical protein